MTDATIPAPPAPDLTDGPQRRAWLMFLALQSGVDLPEAVDQAELAEEFIVGAKRELKALPAPTLTERADDLVAEAGQVKDRSAEVLREAETPGEDTGPLRVSQEAVDKVLVAIAAFGPKVSNRKLIQESGASQETVRKAVLRLRQLGKVRQDGKGAGRQLHVVTPDDPGSDEPEESDQVAAAAAIAPDPSPAEPEPVPDPAANVVRLPAPQASPVRKEHFGALAYLRGLGAYAPPAVGLKFRRCQWIFGEPVKRGCSDHLKCRAPAVEGTPYCAAHLARIHIKREQPA